MQSLANLNSNTTKKSPQIKIEAELVYLLYAQANTAIIGSLLVATLFAYALHFTEGSKMLGLWYLAYFTCSLLRYGLTQLYFWQKPSLDKTGRWKTLFIAMTFVAGLLWGVAGTILVPKNTLYQIFLACSLAGVAGGAVPYFSGSRLVGAFFILPVLLPFAGWLLIQPYASYNLLGYFVCLYALLLLVSLHRMHQTVSQAIQLKFENDDLIQNLFVIKNEVELMNQELRNEISERKIIEKLLRDSEEQYRLVTNALPVLISYVDLRLCYRFNNKAHEEWFGRPLQQITGKSMKDILDKTAFAIFSEYYRELQSHKQITYESLMQFKKDDERYVSVTLIPYVKNQELRGFFSLISDISPRINYLATHDSLTDLPNRGLFNTRFSNALKNASLKKNSLGLLFIDLDHFKNINDTLGHSAGDELLIRMVRKIKTYLRDDATFARIGGDEFAIILENITTDSLLKVTERIHCAFEEPFHIEGHEIFTTISIGISVYPDDGQDMQLLLKNADLALYRAKEKGRNIFEFYTAELNEKVTRRLKIETELHTALENKEFLLYYQPIIDVKEKRVSSLEALLRWKNPTLGFVTPDEFITIAEENNSIISISEWVLKTAFSQHFVWQEKARNFLCPQIAINLSARHFKEKNLVEKIKSLLEQTGTRGEDVMLELTEGFIMQDVERSTNLIHKLKNLGLGISIDDFGTGYSSLSYLRRFPIDVIKIDRSFISELSANSGDSAIVNAIIIMAHSLNMKVIAEGVETLQQYDCLQSLHCDEIQGFIISPPQPIERIEKIMGNANFVKEQLAAIKLKSEREVVPE